MAFITFIFVKLFIKLIALMNFCNSPLHSYHCCLLQVPASNYLKFTSYLCYFSSEPGISWSSAHWLTAPCHLHSAALTATVKAESTGVLLLPPQQNQAPLSLMNEEKHQASYCNTIWKPTFYRVTVINYSFWTK